MRLLALAILSGLSCAGVTLALCYLHGGGGLGIEGAVLMLSGTAGVVGFFAGLLAFNG
ncbi:MAG TPA: hypothetical protein VEK15_27300 [Vicinamibacteria bacterium]|nr:hypothetical protein [Vicinamibacteria bacterium]